MKPLNPPSLVSRVAEVCLEAGGRCFLVGGGVRDHLMGSVVKDWDIEVFGLDVDTLERALKRVGKVNAVGRSFAVLKLHRGDLELDISIPRRDSKRGPGHRGIVAEGDPSMTPREAAQRRDLTINALMFDLHAHALVDPAGGLADLEAGRLRAVDAATFLEDPLRALRVVQFAARTGFSVDPELLELCRNARLDELPEERIELEWTKLLLKGTRPSVGLEIARRAEITSRVFPELIDDPVVDDALDRAATLRAEVRPPGRALALMWVVWTHRTPHSDLPALLDRAKLHRWNSFPTRETILAAHRRLADPTDTDAALRWLSTRADVDVSLAARQAISAPPTAPEVFARQRDRARALKILHEAPPRLLQGRDLVRLGHQPGPHMGRLLDRIYAAQLDGEIQTAAQAEALASRLAE